MLRLIQSRRLLYSLSKNNNTHSNIKKKIFFSSSVSQESILASFTAESLSLKNTSPFGSLLKFSESQSAKKMSLLRFGMKSPFVSLLKFGIFSATATAGYATYMYTTKQVEEFTKEFRLSTKKITVADDASFVENYKALLYSVAMIVPAKCIEIYLNLRRSIEEKVQDFSDPYSDKLLPNMYPREQMEGIKTIVLDLEETLIYTHWTRDRGFQVIKRPGLELFLRRLAQCCEVVVYSDQDDSFVESVIARLNQENGVAIHYNLSRAATKFQNGKYYRDLSKLNRDLSRIIYISAHALENALQPENCVPIKPFKLEEGDTTLVDLLPFLEFVARQGPAAPDMRQVLAACKGCDIASEFPKHQWEMLEKGLQVFLEGWTELKQE